MVDKHQPACSSCSSERLPEGRYLTWKTGGSSIKKQQKKQLFCTLIIWVLQGNSLQKTYTFAKAKDKEVSQHPMTLKLFWTPTLGLPLLLGKEKQMKIRVPALPGASKFNSWDYCDEWAEAMRVQDARKGVMWNDYTMIRASNVPEMVTNRFDFWRGVVTLWGYHLKKETERCVVSNVLQ